MKDNVWFVPFGGEGLISPFEHRDDESGLFIEGESFAVMLRSVYIDRRLEGFLRSKNSFIILSHAAMEERPPVLKIHYFEDSVPFNQVVASFIADSLFWCEYYPGGQTLRLELVLMEVDTDAGERRETKKAADVMASFAGAAYPLLLPYLQTPPEVGVAMGKVRKAMNTGRRLVRYPLTLDPFGLKWAHFRKGYYVLFANPTHGAKYAIDSKAQLVRKDRKPVDESYVVLQVKSGAEINGRWIILEKAAALLTRLEKPGVEECLGALDFLEEIMKCYTNYQRLARFHELKDMDTETLSDRKRDFLQRLMNNPELRPFLK